MFTFEPPADAIRTWIASPTPPWHCAFDASPVTVATGERLRIDVQMQVTRVMGTDTNDQFMLASAYRTVSTGEVTRGPIADWAHFTVANLTQAPITTLFLTDALSADDYELGYCFNDGDDFDYLVRGRGIATLVPASVP